MPKVSKVGRPSRASAHVASGSKPGQTPYSGAGQDAYYCCRCERRYPKQKNNFPASQSSLFFGNGKYLPLCYRCVDELYEHYRVALGSEEAAIRRLCLKLDIYWSPEIYATLDTASSSQSLIRSYISRTNLVRYIGKTYDDTLDECDKASMDALADEKTRSAIEQEQMLVDMQNELAASAPAVTPKVMRYWGVGFTPEMYRDLENRRNYWLSQYPPDTVLEPGEEALLRQICILEISINRDAAAGNSIEKGTNALNNLLGSMNIKPSQKKEAIDNSVPFGCEIAKFEEELPIPEPDEDFKDVDKIHKNVISWFLGSLCKTAGIKNIYSQYFDEEVAKYTVERPVYEDIDEDAEEGGVS